MTVAPILIHRLKINDRENPSSAAQLADDATDSDNAQTQSESNISGDAADEVTPEMPNETAFPSTNSAVQQALTANSTKARQKPHSKMLTDYFPVRRSFRKTKRAVEQECLRHIETAIEKQLEDGLMVVHFKDKGRGICARRPFARGEFVVEYIGQLIEQAEADRREKIYAKDAKFGCYMYYFRHKEQQWW